MSQFRPPTPTRLHTPANRGHSHGPWSSSSQKLGDETCGPKGDLHTPGSHLPLADSAGYGLPSPQTESQAKATKASTALVSVHGRSETLTLLPFRGRFLATSHRPRARCANGDLGGTAGHVLGDLGEEPRLWGLTWDSQAPEPSSPRPAALPLAHLTPQAQPPHWASAQG